MYILTNNKPYYPTVEYFENLDDAIKEAEEILEFERLSDGDIVCCVSISKVIKTQNFNTYG